MKKLFLSFLTLAFLSSGAYGIDMKCVNGSLDIAINSILTSNGGAISKDKVLSAKGKFSTVGSNQTTTQAIFKDGKIVFQIIRLYTGLRTPYDIDFSALIVHKTSSADGEWSTYEIPAGHFHDKSKGPAYLQVNNVNNTATLFKSLDEKDTWSCK